MTEVFMANEKIPLMYKGHPLRRKDNLIYYGDMADSHIILLQIMDTKPVGEHPAAAHRPRPEGPGPGRQTQRERQFVRRH